ncbi:MAG: hypothetical protein WC679_02345 [Bacteroidales bacterium]|jgi:hypothetical protein
MIDICKKLCNDCPFSSKSMPGFLGGYTIDDIMQFMQFDALFPCHKFLQDDTQLSVVNSGVRRGEIPLCRGYGEMMIKSCKLPKAPAFSQVLKEIKESGNISDDSMSIFEFIKHHTITKC